MYQVRIKSGETRMGSIPLESKQKVHDYLARNPLPMKSEVEIRNVLTNRTEKGTKRHFIVKSNR